MVACMENWPEGELVGVPPLVQLDVPPLEEDVPPE